MTMTAYIPHLGPADVTVDFSADRIGLRSVKTASNTATVIRSTKYRSTFSAIGDRNKPAAMCLRAIESNLEEIGATIRSKGIWDDLA
jgi:hypothetical protein